MSTARPGRSERDRLAPDPPLPMSSRVPEPSGRVFSPEGVGAVVAFLDTNGFDRRRFTIVNRLRALRDSEQFAALPEDLRERVREIVADVGP